MIDFCNNLIDSWNYFHSSCILFYLVYGLLCFFMYVPYCKHIYFRGRWNNAHSQDKILEYFAIGAGECCIVMAVLTTFCYYLMLPEISDFNIINHRPIVYRYVEFQIFCWVMWFLTELYYTVKGIEWPIIGSVHVILCGIVLFQVIMVYLNLQEFNF